MWLARLQDVQRLGLGQQCAPCNKTADQERHRQISWGRMTWSGGDAPWEMGLGDGQDLDLGSMAAGHCCINPHRTNKRSVKLTF